MARWKQLEEPRHRGNLVGLGIRGDLRQNQPRHDVHYGRIQLRTANFNER